MVRASALRLKRSRVRSSVVSLQVTTLGKLFAHMCLSSSSKFGTGKAAVMPCGWEGNRRSGVALVMCHRLQWFIHLLAHGLRKGDEHSSWGMALFTFARLRKTWAALHTSGHMTKNAQKWSQGASGPRSRAENYNTGCNLYTDQPNGGSQQLQYSEAALGAN